jgi:hypothetical protein
MPPSMPRDAEGPLQRRLHALAEPDPYTSLVDAIEALVGDAFERLLEIEEHVRVVRRDLHAIHAKLHGDLYL